MEKAELVSNIRELGFVFWEANRMEFVQVVFKEVLGHYYARIDYEEHTVRQLRKVYLKLKVDYKKWYLYHQEGKKYINHGFGNCTGRWA